MILKKIFGTISLLLFISAVFSQAHHQRFASIDVQHYSFELHLNDSTDKIEGIATVSFKFREPLETVELDIVSINNEQKGMLVESVKQNNSNLNFYHENELLKINLSEITNTNDILEFTIKYSGIPADGLVISENKYGERTFFGDNWPDRAKHWLPTVDHPSDKATLEFKVYAPEHYEVVSNGYLVEKKQFKNDIEFTHWKEDVPLSTKLMAIGVADFAVGNKTEYKIIPVSSWVFEKNREQGFENYKYGTQALEYFSDLIGPYSYEKLAHVQSKTRYGGMENASCIFYHERTATSNQSQERLFAHEVAHQWFGNSVTEQNWHHVWLSEGFATYLTHVYKQHFYGETFFKEGLKADRERVIQYAKRNLAPIIDTTVTDYIRLLNANSYQKASWFLHMLRMELGDEIFFKGLRKYYADYRNSTALTEDFKNIMETVAGKELDIFFKQWLWQPGHPILDLNWKQKDNQLQISVKQIQADYLFTFALELEIVYENGTSDLRTFEVNKSENKFSIQSGFSIKDIMIDTGVKLLFENKN